MGLKRLNVIKTETRPGREKKKHTHRQVCEPPPNYGHRKGDKKIPYCELTVME